MRKGFTLLEVLLATSIFILLAGGIFTAVSVSMSASSAVTLAQWDTERLDGTQRFLQKLFSSLPVESRLDLSVHASGRSDITELSIWPAPGFTSFSRIAEEQGLLVSAQPDGKGALVLSVTNFDPALAPARRVAALQKAVWMKLLPEVRAVKWRFTSREKTGLQETWEAADGRPTMASLELKMVDGSEENWFFIVPALQVPASAQPAEKVP